jgi:hypothetical protein
MSSHLSIAQMQAPLSSTGWGECVFSGICGRMAETKSLWEEPDTGHQLTQEADSTDRGRVARRSRSSRRTGAPDPGRPGYFE